MCEKATSGVSRNIRYNYGYILYNHFYTKSATNENIKNGDYGSNQQYSYDADNNSSDLNSANYRSYHNTTLLFGNLNNIFFI